MVSRIQRAFTLIELLIVVAIIAILAAIAVPNFLEAQTRAKVSRVKADVRSLGVAAESYYVDNNDYPPNNAGPVGGGIGDQFRYMEPLSTPIAYIVNSRYQDPFGNEYIIFDNASGESFYFYYRVAETDILSQLVVDGAFTEQSERDVVYGWRYVIGSAGPDRAFTIQQNSLSQWTFPGDWIEWVRDSRTADDIYDPTNGTVSGGDIWFSAKGFREGAND